MQDLKPHSLEGQINYKSRNSCITFSTNLSPGFSSQFPVQQDLRTTVSPSLTAHGSGAVKLLSSLPSSVSDYLYLFDVLIYVLLKICVCQQIKQMVWLLVVAVHEVGCTEKEKNLLPLWQWTKLLSWKEPSTFLCQRHSRKPEKT